MKNWVYGEIFTESYAQVSSSDHDNIFFFSFLLFQCTCVHSFLSIRQNHLPSQYILLCMNFSAFFFFLSSPLLFLSQQTNITHSRIISMDTFAFSSLSSPVFFFFEANKYYTRSEYSIRTLLSKKNTYIRIHSSIVWWQMLKILFCSLFIELKRW